MTVNTITLSAGNVTTFGGSTQNCTIAGYNAYTGTEANTDITMRDAGVFSHLWVEVDTNSNTPAPVLRTRRNSANASQIVTITALTTGNFEDVTNTDTVTAAEKYHYQCIAGATGTLSMRSVSTLFAATTNATTRAGQNGNFAQTVASTTNFWPMGGREFAAGTEANAKTRQRKAGTMTQIQANVTTNSRAQASTVKSRLNGADGALTQTITGSTTGIFEDQTHSDTIAATNDWCFANVTGTSTGTLTVSLNNVSFNSTAQDGCIHSAPSTSTTQNANLTRYYIFGSDCLAITTEDLICQLKVRDTFVLSEITMLVITNTTTADSSFNSRINTAAGAQSATITNGTAGVFSDSVHTDSVTSTALLASQLITGATGTSLIFSQFSIYTNQTPAGAVTARPRTRAINMSPYLSMNLGPGMSYGVGNQGGINI